MLGRGAVRQASKAVAKRLYSTVAVKAATPAARSKAAVIAAGAAVGLGAAMLSETNVVHASGGDILTAPEYPFNHKGMFDALDTASMRRGFEVYRQVCSTCHSMDYIAYRQLVGASHTELQAKALAESIEVKDGPNEKGEYYMRPGRLSDYFKRPYPNDEFGRYVNGGALPPDLSLMKKARFRGDDYIFSLLTGYKEPPAGITLRQGLSYNPYFPGGAIAMPPPLSDGQVEFEDKTPATVSQMAKDVSVFLTYTAEPEHNTRKKLGVQSLVAFSAAIAVTAYYKRFRWSVIKNRRIRYVDLK